MTILEEAGIAFYADESLAILREHGASVDEETADTETLLDIVEHMNRDAGRSR